MTKTISFQSLIFTLQQFWAKQNCLIMQPSDTEVGAGTLSPATALHALAQEQWNVAYVQPCRRPKDGRYGQNPNRLQHYYQFQVIMKPVPENFQDLCLESLEAIGISPKKHDIRFVEDDWENPTIGAWGLGWEVWCDGMEVMQYTYMQQIGGISCDFIPGELTYGLERLAMYVQNVDNVYDLAWNEPGFPHSKTYGDIYLQTEKQFSQYCLDEADVEIIRQNFDNSQSECEKALTDSLPIVAYHHCLKACHFFNLLDSRGAISVSERASLMAKVRHMAKNSCQMHYEQTNLEQTNSVQTKLSNKKRKI